MRSFTVNPCPIADKAVDQHLFYMFTADNPFFTHENRAKGLLILRGETLTLFFGRLLRKGLHERHARNWSIIVPLGNGTGPIPTWRRRRQSTSFYRRSRTSGMATGKLRSTTAIDERRWKEQTVVVSSAEKQRSSWRIIKTGWRRESGNWAKQITVQRC